MPIVDAGETLSRLERLHSELRRYRDLFNADPYAVEVEALRAELTLGVAECADDLNELRVSRLVDWAGHRMDILHTALTPVANVDPAVPGQALDVAVQCMENAVGSAKALVRRRRADSRWPRVRTLLLYVTVALVAYTWGRHRESI